MNFFKNAVFKREFLIFALIFLSFSFYGVRNLDPDFGWHVRMGELISTSGIPKTDPFSYSMPSFPFVDHEWLTNVVLAKLYPIVGHLGLAIIFSFIALSALLISLKTIKETFVFKNFNFYLKSGLFLLASGTVFPFFGVRPQVISWLFLAILLKIVSDPVFWAKWRFVLPFFFIVWANLHGGFALGIFTLFFVMCLRLFQKVLQWQDFLAVFFCLIATFITPYGARLWGEVFMQLSDGGLRFKIAEWTPAFLNINFPFMALASLSFLILFRYRKTISFEKISLYTVFLLAAISSQRHVPLWAILSLPLMFEGLGLLYQQIRAIKDGSVRFNKVANFLFIGSLLLFVVQSLIFITPGSLAEKNFYPAKAVDFLKDNLSEGQVFSNYNWGGYLIWKLPGKRVFIDGRMPSWRWRKNAPTESANAMEDYEKILKGETPFSEVEKKYNITTVLFPSRRPPNPFERLESKLWELLGKKTNNDFLGELVKNGWQKIYEDKTAVIYQKKP